jgi:hypothetical protein
MPWPALDRMNAWLLGAAVVFLLLAGFEAGFWAARKLGDDAEKSLAGVLAAALLALLGLLLAFCFGIVEARFSARRGLVIEEARAIETAYLRADLLAPPSADRVRALLRRYTGVRLRVHSVATLEASSAQAEALQAQLWREGVAVANQDPHSEMTALFIHALNDVFDLRREHTTVALYHRLPPAMTLTLLAVAVLAMVAHGYGGGLDRRRALLSTLMLVFAVSAVLLVIVELDRPWQHMFRLNQQALQAVQESMTR